MRSRLPAANALAFVAAMAGLMWLVEILDAALPWEPDRYGIQPRDGDGLAGIVAAPFLHSGFLHLIGNTFPFLVMGALIALNGLARVLAVTAIAAAVSGAGVWLAGPANSVTVGASGVVFGYATYLIARGFFDRRPIPIAVGVLVGIFWGGALLGGLLPSPGVSWQAHLFGALGGVLAARVLAPGDRPRLSSGGRTPEPLTY
jgi:membrane associated rhomboid family serine protease